MLFDLQIKNYRLFDNFRLDDIARVNLIVGTNNSGKSSLLEAIHLLTSGDTSSSLFFILEEREKRLSRLFESGIQKQNLAYYYQISHLFNGYNLQNNQNILIQSGKFNDNYNDNYLSIILEEGEPHHYPTTLILEHHFPFSDESREILEITEDGLLSRSVYNSRSNSRGKSHFVTTSHLGYNDIASLWDNITLTPKEEKVVEALQIIDPNIERLGFTSRQTSNSGILLKLKNKKEPVPLGIMGDGSRRVLTIAASLVSAEDGTLLVDEIDTGLYYGILTDMWRIILETATKSDAQVFATTHSWDCVRAFQQALEASSDPNLGRLIRLEQKDGQLMAVTYSSHELDIAIEHGIEVR